MRPLRLVLALVLLLAIAPIGVSQERPTNRSARERAVARWKKFAPAERQELLRRYQEFKRLPPEARERIRKNIGRYLKMSPQQRQAIREKLMRMSPEERREFLARTTGFAQMPPPKRFFVKALGRLLGLSAEEQQRIRALPAQERMARVRALVDERFASRFLATEEERRQFQAAPPDARLRKIQQVLVQRVQPRFPPPRGPQDDPEEFDFK